MRKIIIMLLALTLTMGTWLLTACDKKEQVDDSVSDSQSLSSTADSSDQSDEISGDSADDSSGSDSSSGSQDDSGQSGIVEKYTVTVVGGTGGGEFDKDTEITVTATVPAGKVFVKWSDGVTYVSTSNPYTFSVEKDVTLTAVFEDDLSVSRTFAFEGENLTIPVSECVKGESVIEFSYKRNSAGTIGFAVLGRGEEGLDWNNFYGYYTITDDNLTSDSGVQVRPVGEEWDYVGNSTDEISDSMDLWYNVVIDPLKLTKAYGDPSDKDSVVSLFFNPAYTTATAEMKGFTVRERTIEDGCYYARGKNNAAYRVFSGTEIDLTDKSELTFYFKQISGKGDQDGVQRLALYFNVGSDGSYINFYTASPNAVAIGKTDKAWASFETVEEGEYTGWYKATIDLTQLSTHEGTLTTIYNRYTRGEFLFGGFNAV